VLINLAQQMIFRNLIFEAEVVKQRLPAGMVSHHEQQASECEDKQRHRELWPAYNANLAPPQASTEGLFQQTQALGQAYVVCSPKIPGQCIMKERPAWRRSKPDAGGV